MTPLDAPPLRRLHYSIGEEINREPWVAIFQKHGGASKCRDPEDLNLYSLQEGRKKSAEGVVLKAARLATSE